LVQAAFRRPAQCGALAVVVRPRIAAVRTIHVGDGVERAGKIGRRSDRHRASDLRSVDAAELPAGNQPVGGSQVVEQTATLAERKFERVIEDQALLFTNFRDFTWLKRMLRGSPPAFSMTRSNA
jgi:hypothetical protein